MAPMAGGGNRGGDSRLDHRHHHTSGASRSDDDDDEGADSKAESQLNGNGVSSSSNGNGGSRSEIRPRSPVAETLFRKDLISAMKLPDNEPLTADDYWVVADTWKQEWERGVQVPFKPEALPEPHVSRLANPPHSTDRFTFPKKLLCMSRRGTYTSDTHQVTTAALRSEQMCNYDLDELDQRWLNAANGERAQMGVTSISDLEMERTMAELEKQSWEKINLSLKQNEEEEQDDSVICDVCRSPDSEEHNEMVFCDSCNICVHQACYGITSIPSGSWLCRTCALGSKPKCELCPNKGGAMKSTKSGQKWAHVSCALWIPEVSIGCVEKMEPITKINSIPQSRWNLLCVLCKDRVGSCIQCSVKTCKVAYHVTCAFKRGLEMRAIIEDENADDGVKLRSYCQMHSMNQKRRESEDSDDDTKGKKKSKTAEERSLERRQKLLKIECEFYKGIDLSQVSKYLGIEQDIIDFIFRFWILKRKSLGNRPLLIPRSDSEVGTGEAGVISSIDGTSQEQDTEREKLKKFVSLRQDLERVRNLCYMVSRREKLQKSFVKLREQIFEKQLDLVADDSNAQQMSLLEISALLEANHGPTVYDSLFSHADAERHTENDFEVIVSRISGEITENSAQIRKDNPYRKLTLPATIDSKKSWAYKRIFSDTSASEEDVLNNSACMPKAAGSRKKRSEGSSGATTSTITAEVAAANAAAMVGKKNNLGKKGNQRNIIKQNHSSSSNKKKKQTASKAIAHSDTSDISSSGEDVKDNDKRKKSPKDKRNHTHLSASSNRKIPSKSFFSDTDSDAGVDSPSFRPKSPVFRTKAAMKDFGVENLPRGGSKKPSKPSEIENNDTKATKSAGRSKIQAHGNKHKAQHKSANKIEQLTKSKYNISDDAESVASSSDVGLSESEDDRKVVQRRRKKAQEDLAHIMIVPERAAARKATAKLKVSQQDKSAVSEVQDQLTAGSGDASSVTSERRSKSKLKKSKEKELFTATDDSQASEDMSTKSDAFGFVPQRKAAKKASAQIKVSDRSKDENNLNIPSTQLSPNKKSPITMKQGKKDKTSILSLSLSQRLHQSDSDSDLEEPFSFRSPREKAARGRGTGGLTKSPRKRATHGSGRGRAAVAPSQPQTPQQPIKKALSSRAEALLSARASQLDVILGRATDKVPDKPNSTTSSVFQSPDKKLKTSDGRLEGPDDGTPKQSVEGEKLSPTISSDATRQRKLDREKRREQRKAKAARRRSSQSSGSSSPSSTSSSSSNVSSDNEAHKRTTNDNADSKQGENNKNRISSSRRGDLNSSSIGAGAAPSPLHSSPAHGSPRSMPPTPEQISEPIGGVADKKKEDRFENRIFEAFKENQAPPPTPGRHLTHIIGGTGSFEDAEEENNEVGEQRLSRQGKYGIPPSVTSPLVSPQRSSQKGMSSSDLKSPSSRLFDKSPNRPLIQSQVNDSTKDSSVICSPKSLNEKMLSSKSPLLPGGGTTSERLARETNSIAPTNASASIQGMKELGKSSHGSFQSDIKKTTDKIPSSGNVMVKQSKQSDEGYGTDAKVSPTEQANSLLPPKESPSLPTVPEATLNQCQETNLSSNSQYDLGQLMRNQQQRKQQQQIEQTRMQQQQRQQELEKQKLQQQQQPQHGQKSGYPNLDQNQWQQQPLGQPIQGQNSQDLDSMQNQQNEALLNFFYKNMQQYAHGNNPQNAYGSMTPQQLQQMRDYGGSYELFAYYQQYFQQSQQSSTYNNLLQQQMGQFSGTPGAGYNKKDMQALEQFMMQQLQGGPHQSQWPSSVNQMSQPQQQPHRNAKDQQKYPEEQEQMFQLLQRQYQQRQNSQQQPHNHQNASTTTSENSHYHNNQAGYNKGNLPSTSAEDLQNQLSSSSLGKVQNTSTASSTGQPGSNAMLQSLSQKPRGSRDSPRQYPTQSPRGGGGSHLQQGGSGITSPSGTTAQSSVPSATPAEKLPGYTGNKKGMNDRHGLTNNVSSIAGKNSHPDTDSGLSIPKELLDSVAAVAAQPVWKPSSERSGGDKSPTKLFTPEGHMLSPDKTPSSVHGSSSTRRGTFEELVKKVESPRTDKATPRSERSLLGSQHEQSDFDRSDYDDTKGGVDYDDFDEDDWTKATPESKPKRGRPKAGAGSQRGRGRGNKSKVVAASEPIMYTTHSAKSNTSIIERITKANRGKQKQKHLNIDKKALAQVHKTVAGTDYDFENEFGDEFGDEMPTTESNQFSLQALREKSKKARESDEESLEDDLPDFDELPRDTISTNRGRGRPARGRGKRGNANVGGIPSRGRGRGRGRGRPALKTFQTSRNQSSKSPSDGKSRESGESSGPDDSDFNRASNFSELSNHSSEGLDPPKLPKLKLGALLISKEPSAKSPKIHKSKKDKSGKKSHRKASVDSKDGVKVPKLTIRLGPKPDKAKENAGDVSETKNDDKKNTNKLIEATSEVDGISAKKGEKQDYTTDLSSKTLKTNASAKSSADDKSIDKLGDNLKSGDEKAVANPFALDLDDANKDAMTFKGLGKFDKGNDKNGTGVFSKQSPKVVSASAKSGNNSELDTIFGPQGVAMSSVIGAATSQTIPNAGSASINEGSLSNKKDHDTEKSELDLIREELMKDKVDSRTPPQASPHADTAYGPLRKAINAARKADLNSSTSSETVNNTFNQMLSSQADHTAINHGVDEAATNESHLMKMKFKNLKMKYKSEESRADPRKSPLSSSVHHQIPSAMGSNDTSQRGGSSMSSNAASMGGGGTNNSSLNASSASGGGQPRSSGGGGYARMRKKELLNQYYGQDIYPAPVNGPSSTSLPPSTQSLTTNAGQLPSSMQSSTTSANSSNQYQRPVSFKMPKAVSSMISVPTRADYQSQLEAIQERKRKRVAIDGNGGNDGQGKGGDGKGGRKKKGRGKQADEDPDFKASHLKVARGTESNSMKSGDGGSTKEVKKPKTRGKPPKKCLAESPPHEEDRVGDMKAESMKFAAAIRAEFESGSSNSSSTGRSSGGGSRTQSPSSLAVNSNLNTSSSQSSKPTPSSLRDVRIPRDKNKRKRAQDDSSSVPVVSKTPKIVIKFAKDAKTNSSTAVSSGKEVENPENANANIGSVSDHKDVDANKNGLDASPFDFVENDCAEALRQAAAQSLPMVDGTVDGSAFSSMNNSPATPGTPISSEGSSSHNKLPKIKIKVPTV